MKSYARHMMAAAALCAALFTGSALARHPAQQTHHTHTPPTAAPQTHTTKSEPVKKVLFIGDSMTGWMAERLNAYGQLHGFEVATVVWDGSTIQKWGATPKLAELVKKEKPDAVFVSLGMNELFERNPESRLGPSVDKILNSLGDTPYLWIGPPAWPGKPGGEKLNTWLSSRLGPGHFFDSSRLTLKRQSPSNPHPSRQGIEKWIDTVVEWLPASESEITMSGYTTPASGKASRGKTYIYKKMKETL